MSPPIAPKFGASPASNDFVEIPSPVTESGPEQPTPLDSHLLMQLSWSHLSELIRLDDPWKRAFYENECLQEWLTAVKQINQTFSRRTAIQHEALRLLQTLTASTLQPASASGHGWYLDPNTQKPIFGQKTAPSFCVEQLGKFWTGQANPIPIIETTIHFQRQGIGPDDTQITFPSNLDANLDKYFALSPN